MNVINLKRVLASNDGNATLDVRGTRVPVFIHTIRADYTHPDKVTELFCTLDPRAQTSYAGKLLPDIKKVIFNDPVTVVIWDDGSKTVVRTQNGEEYDPEKGLAMAISKRAFGNTGSYFEQFKKWCPKPEEKILDMSLVATDEPEEAPTDDIKIDVSTSYYDNVAAKNELEEIAEKFTGTPE